MRLAITNGSVRTEKPSMFGDVLWWISDYSNFGSTDLPTMHFGLSDWQSHGAPYCEALAKKCSVSLGQVRWPSSGEVEVFRVDDCLVMRVFDDQGGKLFTVTFSTTDDHLLADGQNRHAVGGQPLHFNAFYLAMKPILYPVSA